MRLPAIVAQVEHVEDADCKILALYVGIRIKVCGMHERGRSIVLPEVAAEQIAVGGRVLRIPSAVSYVREIGFEIKCFVCGQSFEDGRGFGAGNRIVRPKIAVRVACLLL